MCPQEKGSLVIASSVPSQKCAGASRGLEGLEVVNKGEAPLNQQMIWLVVWNIFYFPFHIWDNPSHWLIFFKMVETTNQRWSVVKIQEKQLETLESYRWESGFCPQFQHCFKLNWQVRCIHHVHHFWTHVCRNSMIICHVQWQAHRTAGSGCTFFFLQYKRRHTICSCIEHKWE